MSECDCPIVAYFNQAQAQATNTLKRVYLKDLEPDMDNILVIGIIIGKQRPRKFPNIAEGPDSFRAVWNFTIRDSPRDYVNVTFWGKSDIVLRTNDKFYTGDVVEIINPRISIRKFDEAGEQYRPMVTSPYALTLGEQSEINPYRGDTLHLQKLLAHPTKPIAAFVPLRDIINEGNSMKERSVDILGAVRSVGGVRSIKTKNDQEAQLLEVVLFDRTSPGLKITFWDPDVMARANSWKPRTTILFITDVQVFWSNFLRSYSTSLTPRSIVTENPIGKDAAELVEYAKTAPLETSAILDQLIMTLPDANSIQNVMSVQQIYNRVSSMLKENTAMEQQITALVLANVTKLNLDGYTPLFSTRCGQCKSWLKSTNCENQDCAIALGTMAPEYDTSFDIRVDLADHTGTLLNCRLSGAVAEQVLNCSVSEFQRLNEAEKRKIKLKFLMEKCAVRIVILMLRGRPLISIISCAEADPIETAQRLPVC